MKELHGKPGRRRQLRELHGQQHRVLERLEHDSGPARASRAYVPDRQLHCQQREFHLTQACRRQCGGQKLPEHDQRIRGLQSYKGPSMNTQQPLSVYWLTAPDGVLRDYVEMPAAAPVLPPEPVVSAPLPPRPTSLGLRSAQVSGSFPYCRTPSARLTLLFLLMIRRSCSCSSWRRSCSCSCSSWRRSRRRSCSCSGAPAGHAHEALLLMLSSSWRCSCWSCSCSCSGSSWRRSCWLSCSLAPPLMSIKGSGAAAMKAARPLCASERRGRCSI